MVIKSSEDWHGCPIRYGTTVLGDGWSMLILRDLMFREARYYADFLNAGEHISTNILAARLCGLEREGIVRKSTDPEHGSRFIYSLTEKGMGLVPAMLEIIDWAEIWDEKTEVPSEFVSELRSDRRALAEKIVTRHNRSASANAQLPEG